MMKDRSDELLKFVPDVVVTRTVTDVVDSESDDGIDDLAC